MLICQLYTRHRCTHKTSSDSPSHGLRLTRDASIFNHAVDSTSEPQLTTTHEDAQRLSFYPSTSTPFLPYRRLNLYADEDVEVCRPSQRRRCATRIRFADVDIAEALALLAVRLTRGHLRGVHPIDLAYCGNCPPPRNSELCSGTRACDRTKFF